MFDVKKAMLLYAVTDQSWTLREPLYDQVEKAIKNGVTCVQFREKNRDYGTMLQEAVALNRLCKEYEIPFLVNDNVALALECGADGVHIGQDDMDINRAREILGEKAIIGVSAHNTQEALAAELAGADYLGVGAIFQTQTKHDVYTISYETLKDITSLVKIPITAIGGIKKENILDLKGSGIDGIAVVSAIFAAEDIADACKTLRALSEQMLEV